MVPAGPPRDWMFSLGEVVETKTELKRGEGGMFRLPVHQVARQF